jgi:hypothetical protein
VKAPLEIFIVKAPLEIIIVKAPLETFVVTEPLNIFVVKEQLRNPGFGEANLCKLPMLVLRVASLPKLKCEGGEKNQKWQKRN